MRLHNIQEAKRQGPNGWFLINSRHERIEAVTDKNFDRMSRDYAIPNPGVGYLGFVDDTGNITHHLMTNLGNQIGTIPGKPW